MPALKTSASITSDAAVYMADTASITDAAFFANGASITCVASIRCEASIAGGFYYRCMVPAVTVNVSILSEAAVSITDAASITGDDSFTNVANITGVASIRCVPSIEGVASIRGVQWLVPALKDNVSVTSESVVYYR